MNNKYDHLWSNMDNWTMGLYNCKDDPRVIVPKMPKWAGRTLNFAHKAQAISLLIATILILVIGPIGCLMVYGPNAPRGYQFWACTFGSLIPIIIFYYSFELKVRKDR